MSRKNLLLLSALALNLAACTTTADVVSTGPDTYAITQQYASSAFTNKDTLKSQLKARADEFADSKGKAAVLVSSTDLHGVTGHMPAYEYKFRLVDRVYQPGTGMAAAVGAPGGSAQPVAAGVSRCVPGTHDIYTELTQLDDLRKKGILTQAEFDQQKRKILAQ